MLHLMAVKEFFMAKSPVYSRKNIVIKNYRQHFIIVTGNLDIIYIKGGS